MTNSRRRRRTSRRRRRRRALLGGGGGDGALLGGGGGGGRGVAISVVLDRNPGPRCCRRCRGRTPAAGASGRGWPWCGATPVGPEISRWPGVRPGRCGGGPVVLPAGRGGPRPSPGRIGGSLCHGPRHRAGQQRSRPLGVPRGGTGECRGLAVPGRALPGRHRRRPGFGLGVQLDVPRGGAKPGACTVAPGSHLLGRKSGAPKYRQSIFLVRSRHPGGRRRIQPPGGVAAGRVDAAFFGPPSLHSGSPGPALAEQPSLPLTIWSDRALACGSRWCCLRQKRRNDSVCGNAK